MPPFDEASTLAFETTRNSASVTADVRPMTVGFAELQGWAEGV
jgi:hypothetical protein